MNADAGAPRLALDTSTGTGSVAVEVDGRVRVEAMLEVGMGASAALLPAVDWALRTAGVRPEELAAVVVGGGPGSFTGVRIAAATAKGIVHALGIPLFAYSGLLAVAAGFAGTERRVCALFDARRRDVYSACYRFSGEGVREEMAPIAEPLERLLERFRGGDPPLFAGEAATLHRDEIRGALGAAVAPAHLSVPRASGLLWAARLVPEWGRVVDPAGWEPCYVRASGAERIAAASGR